MRRVHEPCEGYPAPVHRAVFRDDMQALMSLLSGGAEVNTWCPCYTTEAYHHREFTPIALALRMGHLGIARLLLQHGARASSAVRCAINCNDTEILSALSQLDPDEIDSRLGRHVYMAAEAGRTEVVAWLLRRASDDKPLRHVVRRAVDLREDKKSALAALTTVAEAEPDLVRSLVASEPFLHQAISDNRGEPIIAWLLAHGADPNAKHDRHITPVRLAAREGQIGVLNALRRSAGRRTWSGALIGEIECSLKEFSRSVMDLGSCAVAGIVVGVLMIASGVVWQQRGPLVEVAAVPLPWVALVLPLGIITTSGLAYAMLQRWWGGGIVWDFLGSCLILMLLLASLAGGAAWLVTLIWFVCSR